MLSTVVLLATEVQKEWLWFPPIARKGEGGFGLPPMRTQHCGPLSAIEGLRGSEKSLQTAGSVLRDVGRSLRNFEELLQTVESFGT